MEKNTYSPESTIPSSSAASSISRMVVELAHITTTEIEKRKITISCSRAAGERVKIFINIIAAVARFATFDLIAFALHVNVTRVRIYLISTNQDKQSSRMSMYSQVLYFFRR